MFNPIYSTLNNPIVYQDQIYCIQGQRIDIWQGREVYLATHPFKTLNFWERCLSLIFGSLLALFFQKSASIVWFNKGMVGKETIAVAVVIDRNSSSDSIANRINSMIKNRQADDEYEIGYKYKNGFGVKKDFNQARVYFESAIKKGNRDAAYQLGIMYWQGEGGEVDKDKATKYFKLVVNHGNANAVFCLGEMYSVGLGVGVNHDKAIECFGKAMALGSTKLDCIYDIGYRYKYGTGGKTVNYYLANKYLELAANNGHADAAHQVGLLYSAGLGVGVNHDKAIECFGKAIALGSTKLDCIYQIGYHYKYGKGGKTVNYYLAKKYLELAANNGHADAAYQLGLIYREGLGMGVNHDKAIECFGKAMALGSSKLDCIYDVGYRYKYGTDGKTVNYYLAKKYLELAANNGYADAAYQLGLMYSAGLESKVNQYQAKEYLEKAITRRGGLDLALHYRTQGKISEAQRLEDAHKTLMLGIRAPIMTNIGGVLLTIASNLPQLEEGHRRLNPSTHTALFRERSAVISLLNREEVLPEENIPFREPKKGICIGMTMEFITRLNNLASVVNLESELIKIAQNFEFRPGITAVALQSMSILLMDRINSGHLAYHTIFPIKASHLFNLEEFQRRIRYCEATHTILTHLYKVRGQRLVSLPTLGVPGELSDTECLKQWLTGPDGNYGVVIKVANDTYHNLAFIKQGGQVYIWDPSLGLIKCSAVDPADTIIQYLSKSYPGLDNHHLDICRIERLVPSVS